MPKPVRRAAYPPPLPPNKPQQPGTLVTGYTPSGIFGYPGHKGHLFLVKGRFRDESEFTNSGYRVAVLCLLCRCDLSSDGEFASVVATEDDQIYFMAYMEGLEQAIGKAREGVERYGRR